MKITLDYPPVWLALFMVIAWGIAQVHAPLGDALLWPGRALILSGLIIMVWAAMMFRRQRTTIVPHETPSALVAEGPYRWSRNPIYVADIVILAGWCMSLGTPLALITIPPLWWVLHTRFVLPEEARLSATLGRAYTDYCQQVPRWMGWPVPGG